MSKLNLSVLLLALSILFSGCSLMFALLLNYQDIMVEANDGDVYDFYQDGKLVCSNTNRCYADHDQDKICQHVFEAKRGDVVFGTLHYGYWEEQNFVQKLTSDRDDKKCPEGITGAKATIKIDQVIKAREEALERKRRKEEKAQNIARWNESPLSSSSASH
jgi:hypothetical protein